MRPIVLDIATTVLADAGSWIADDPIEAPSNYKDPDKIAQFIAEKREERLNKAALDPDCCAISALGLLVDGDVDITTLEDSSEPALIQRLADVLRVTRENLVTFNGLRFDLPVLQRRAMYLGVPLNLQLDRYRCPHIDLYDVLTCKGLTTAHNLGWYRRRFGWLDIDEKPLTGEQEAKAPGEHRWAELTAAVRHDLLVTTRLAERLRVMQPLTTAA